ncbi:MAG TPA: hypothetical protein VFE25_04110 [Opitutaceae bacterium]|nr:hypothetical protein [Opitutaceae bacterium]
MLFMGADISVTLGGEPYPVRDVVGASWVLMIAGQEKLISTKQAATNIRITPNLKLSEGSATIVNFSRMASYTFANDPSVILTRRMANTAMTTALLQGVALDAEHYTDTLQNNGLGGAQSFVTADKQFGDPMVFRMGPSEDALKFARRMERVAHANAESATIGVGPSTSRGLDAMNIDFTISSPKPLYNPYVVTMTRFHPKDAKPGLVQNLIYAEALNPVGDKPLRVHIEEDGFPFDYEVVDFQLHVYNRGVEVATSISPNRSDMTRDEAFDYVVAEYIKAHPGATRPPVAAMGHMPAALPTRLAAGDYVSPFYVRVSSEGMGDEVFADAACTKKMEDPFLDSVVKELRFKPALDRGKPAPGIAEVNLGKLQI